MKKIIKYSNYFGFILALCMMVISGCSCSAPKPTPDPLAGFHEVGIQHLDNNKTITADYQAYIQTLSPEEQRASSVFFFEDGTGQHAVMIKMGLNETVWQHVLIYDKDDKRIKTIKYSPGGYRS
jgi:outer membrane biogenesis lipoprotein LolB